MNKFKTFRGDIKMYYLLREGAKVVYLLKPSVNIGERTEIDTLTELSHEATHVKNVNWKTLGVRAAHGGWALYQ